MARERHDLQMVDIKNENDVWWVLSAPKVKISRRISSGRTSMRPQAVADQNQNYYG